jgi:branched-chain amino acid transport system ATP-binding protein
MDNLLEVHDVSKSFGGVLALDKVNLVARSGQMVGLIGPNGAGKSTLFNVISGVIYPSSGKVIFNSKDITRLSVPKRTGLGIARTFQRVEMFQGLSAREHLELAIKTKKHQVSILRDLFIGFRLSSGEKQKIDAILDAVGLPTDLRSIPVNALSLGHSRMVELARALVSDPQLLLLDEPSSGLDFNESKVLADAAKSYIKKSNAAALFVEHDVELVTKTVDHLYVMEAGKMLANGLPEEVVSLPEVKRAYMGVN